MKEIGSEFWENSLGKVDKRYYLSGRTSLDAIVRDILCTTKIRTVLLPSYCCHTMIAPFIHYQFHVIFYDIFYDEAMGTISAEIPNNNTEAVFYYLSYFGFSEIRGLNFNYVRKKYSIVIDDRTHSWLRKEYKKALPDYSFASFRKWGAFSGIADVCKYNGKFAIDESEKVDWKYIYMRDKAYDMKREYFEGSGEKKLFLDLFHQAEEYLETEYIDLKPSYVAIDTYISTDWESISEKRRDNAETLIKNILDIKELVLPFTELKKDDVPLFVPILVNHGRDELRKYLIDNAVYCPIHWPKSSLHNINTRCNLLYENELSLVCDQRYGKAEMLRISALIREYYGYEIDKRNYY